MYVFLKMIFFLAVKTPRYSVYFFKMLNRFIKLVFNQIIRLILMVFLIHVYYTYTFGKGFVELREVRHY
jgi:hypothetical protein